MDKTQAIPEIFFNPTYEAFWLKKAASALNLPIESPNELILEKLRPYVSELSDLFTIKRPEHFQDYMSNPKLLTAYGLFFFPQSFARATFAINRLTKFYAWNQQLSPCEKIKILDLGSGAAPCGLAAAEILHLQFPEKPIELTAIDRSQTALASLPAMQLPAWIQIKTQPADLKKFAGTLSQFDLIILGWSLNEILPAETNNSVETALVFLKKLAPALSNNGTLLILEPALKETAERLQKCSDYFARNPGLPFFRIAPELGEHPCPLLAEGITWNHEVRKWTAPESLEFLNRKLFREIQVVKFSWCALCKKKIPQNINKQLLRLISPIEITKAALRFSAVTPKGEKINIEIPTRGKSKSECKKISAQWERGDIANYTGTLQQLGTNGHFRLNGEISHANSL